LPAGVLYTQAQQVVPRRHAADVHRDVQEDFPVEGPALEVHGHEVFLARQDVFLGVHYGQVGGEAEGVETVRGLVDTVAHRLRVEQDGGLFGFIDIVGPRRVDAVALSLAFGQHRLLHVQGDLVPDKLDGLVRLLQGFLGLAVLPGFNGFLQQLGGFIGQGNRGGYQDQTGGG